MHSNIEFDQERAGRTIKEIFSSKELIFIGLSHKPNDFSRSVYKEFEKRGYRLHPVNPNPFKMDDATVLANVSDIVKNVESAYIIVNHHKVLDLVKQCHEKGVKRIWLHRGTGQGSVNREAVQYCWDNQIEVVPGGCPFMFFEDTMFLHKIHRWWLNRKDKLPVLPN